MHKNFVIFFVTFFYSVRITTNSNNINLILIQKCYGYKDTRKVKGDYYNSSYCSNPKWRYENDGGAGLGKSPSYTSITQLIIRPLGAFFVNILKINAYLCNLFNVI